ncbi:hypothetical protein C8J57DRAFT_10055 [Mycena rebaudengoi]|nr:hypothetical protein C8J57DRAFT_10055 [Mycena rebaudengoi]
MSIALIPPELYALITRQIDERDLQQSLLALSRALPSTPIPLDLLFERVTITRGSEQAIQLTRRLLQPDGEDAATHVQHFCLQDEWTIDAEVTVNLLRKLPNLRSLSLCIGTNFAPEHLEAILKRPMAHLQYLSLRFRPYVQRATYQQFLSGSYFDSTLGCLARWPDSSLPTLSIVQDPMDPLQAPQKAFAQPLVFFRLDSELSNLAQSPFLYSLTSLKFRIPSRQVAHSICRSPLSLPSVELLDLSTCNVTSGDIIDILLPLLPRLKHLILDGCIVLRGEYRPEDWAAFGKSCALSGVTRSKVREKKLRQARLETVPVARPERKGRRGRRGVSTATVSLRASPPRESRVVGTAQGAAASNARVRIFPASPSLRSLSITLLPSIALEKHAEIRQEFEKGWFEGLSQILEIRGRLYKSSNLGTKIMMFAQEEELDESEEGLDGLVDVSNWEDSVDIGAPVLCFAGPSSSEAHQSGCAHSLAWNVWKE